jgi:alkylation response protein AidB-like acyl-CoA dehydrogenase
LAAFDRETRELMIESLEEYRKRNLQDERLIEIDREGDFPVEGLKEMYDHDVLGIHLVLIPEEFGGLGASNYDAYRICELLARIDLGIATGIFSTFLGLDPIRVGGTEEQKKKWMGKVADENLIFAYGATGAEAGSDLGNLTTKADRIMENGEIKGYVINGSKSWISNGGIADVYMILARCEGGMTWFIVERDREGMEYGAPEDKHGIRAANTVAFSMSDVYVPRENLVGLVEGQGFSQAKEVFGYTRLMVAAFGLGCGCEAIERAIRYSQTRIQAGGPLSDTQGYTHKLIVPHAVKLAAGRAYIEMVAAGIDEARKDWGTEGAIAKYFTTRAANEAADASIQAMGGFGYAKEYLVEKIMRDVRITKIYEGTDEIMERTISQARWQEHLKSRATYYHDLSRKMDEIHRNHGEIGADHMSLASNGLNVIMERCREQKLTRNQHVSFKLGELCSDVEVSLNFVTAVMEGLNPESFPYDRETQRAMARVRSRDCALKVINEGMSLVMGSGTGDPDSFYRELKVSKVMVGQKGRLSDMDLIASKLKGVFKAS